MLDYKIDVWYISCAYLMDYESKGVDNIMSQLVGIVQRLKSLQGGGEQGEVQQRLFELNGKTLCQVKYFPNKDTFELEVYDKDGKGSKYPFDDIDMTAIEIFELLQEAKQQEEA
jgi:uncharacterized protein YkuJ